jgi:beta-galactosidase
VTSYDYDAPLDESGRPTPKYFAYRKELAKWSACGNESCLPPVPAVAAPIVIPSMSLPGLATLWENLPEPLTSALPVPMETFGQNFGYILYRTQLPEPVHGNLVIKDVHDFAIVYIDGKLAGPWEHPPILDRRYADAQGNVRPIPISTTGPAQLDILVANDGRVNVDHTMRTENKGITQLVVLDGRPLSDWQIYLLPMNRPPSSLLFKKSPDQLPVGSKGHPHGAVVVSGIPIFRRGTFDLKKTGDTFLDFGNLDKGVIWINGHNLGRFWDAGPQQTLYVPGPWLKTGRNEIVIFDLLQTHPASVSGSDHPILNGPVSDKTGSDQE